MTPIAQKMAMLNSAPRIRQTMPVRIKVLPPVLAWVGETIATLAGVNQNPVACFATPLPLPIAFNHRPTDAGSAHD